MNGKFLRHCDFNRRQFPMIRMQKVMCALNPFHRKVIQYRFSMLNRIAVLQCQIILLIQRHSCQPLHLKCQLIQLVHTWMHCNINNSSMHNFKWPHLTINDKPPLIRRQWIFHKFLVTIFIEPRIKCNHGCSVDNIVFHTVLLVVSFPKKIVFSKTPNREEKLFFKSDINYYFFHFLSFCFLTDFLLHPYRKPKRIRTAFAPMQLLELENAFEGNQYVVGSERKELAKTLNLTETQVKISSNFFLFFFLCLTFLLLCAWMYDHNYWTENCFYYFTIGCFV